MIAMDEVTQKKIEELEKRVEQLEKRVEHLQNMFMQFIKYVQKWLINFKRKL